MGYRLGRLLQLAGLIILPVAVAGNLAEIPGSPYHLSLKQMLALAAGGVAVFYLGWWLQRKAST